MPSIKIYTPEEIDAYAKIDLRFSDFLVKMNSETLAHEQEMEKRRNNLKKLEKELQEKFERQQKESEVFQEKILKFFLLMQISIALFIHAYFYFKK